MSIENDLNRIANALEALVVHWTSVSPDEQYDPSEGSEAPPAGAAAGAAGPKRTRRTKAQAAAAQAAAAQAAAAQAAAAQAAAAQAAAAQAAAAPVEPAVGAPVPDNLTLPALRVRFAALATKGKREQLIKVLEDRGFKVLPDVPVERYPELWRALDALEAS